MKFATLKDLPEKARCLLCTLEKPIVEMIVIRRKADKTVTVRPRCKDCHNKRERGHRRDWKTAYLRRWREYNSELNESYWRSRDPKKAAEIQRNHVTKHHHAILIQGRLRRQLGMHVTVTEAEELLKQYGPCYPSRFGLTPKGLRECERIRSSQRRMKKPVRMTNVEIRVMVYADDKRFFIQPRLQKIPYQAAAARLRKWQAEQHARRAA